ncbi:MAG: Wzz/FepE/Etk N-terminal domain-containing protein [Nitrospirota bacterium]
MGPVAEDEPRVTGDAVGEESVELFDYLRVMWSHRWLIGLGTAAAIGLALWYAVSAPRTYQASMLLKVGTVFTSADGGSARLGLIESPKTIAQVLTGDAMLDTLRERLEVPGLTIGALRGALKVQVVKNDLDVAATTLIELKLTLTDPRQAADGLTFLAETLMAEHAPVYAAGLAIIDREQEGLKERLLVNKKQEEGLRLQIADLRAQVSSEARYREGLDRSIARIEAEMSQARARLTETPPNASEALWEQTLFQSRQVHLDELYRERNESELRSNATKTQMFGVEGTATGLAVQRGEYENRIAELTAYRTRSENTKVRSAPVLPSVPVGPQRRLIVGLGAVIGLVSFMLLAFFLEYVRTARERRLYGLR